MKVATIVGARPQFIKSAPVSKLLRDAGHHEILVHTGQHYDRGMSAVFFDELDIPTPNVNLGVGSGLPGWQTAQMLAGLEKVLMAEKPDRVIVYGDTTSTLAGALAACKLQMPVAHVEAGLRSYNRSMPEEHNRRVADHVSDLLFCPTRRAVDNLAREGITSGVHLVGDTMCEALYRYAPLARARSTVLRDLGLTSKGYLLATVHRTYNTDEPQNLWNILTALHRLPAPVVFPLHPRTRTCLGDLDLVKGLGGAAPTVMIIDPVGYLDMLVLEENARLILTDSGGVQKEAYMLGVPCITLRPETEWLETVEAGWNVVAGTDPDRIAEAVEKTDWPHGERPECFGAGDAAARIVSVVTAASAGLLR